MQSNASQTATNLFGPLGFAEQYSGKYATSKKKGPVTRHVEIGLFQVSKLKKFNYENIVYNYVFFLYKESITPYYGICIIRQVKRQVIDFKLNLNILKIDSIQIEVSNVPRRLCILILLVNQIVRFNILWN